VPEPITLGIHIGHHASCALVVGDELVAGVQKERLSGRKHDSIEFLDNSLPVAECLSVADIELADVNHIVTSFQALSPGGFGLHRPLATPDFNLFDVYDPRHFVISHHLAHAHCAAGASAFPDTAVLVADLAGSSTHDGMDFALPFTSFLKLISDARDAREVKTECLSFFDYTSGTCRLLDREYCVPHNAPESFIQSPASLYDNVSRFIFKLDHAHGQLMALSAFYQDRRGGGSVNLVTRCGDQIIFHNNWQHTIEWGHAPETYSWLAHETQLAFESVLLTYVDRLKQLSQHRKLVLAGGVFLNILANAKIAEKSGFVDVYVPSAPHDAGISIGCAFFGNRVLSSRPPQRTRPTSDRIARSFCAVDEILSVPAILSAMVIARTASTEEVAQTLAGGAIVARFDGCAEFGPRALGGRSILGSPVLAQTKDRLNSAKGRQSWRPVAPTIPISEFARFFIGPCPSPYMTFAHIIRPEYISALPALSHPDGTTRVQTIDNDDDPKLYRLLVEFGAATGFPILVNTSLNGRGRPIIYRPLEALRFFLLTNPVDYLLFGDILLARAPSWRENVCNFNVVLAPGTLLTQVNYRDENRFIVTRAHFSQEIALPTWRVLQSSCGDAFPLSQILDSTEGPVVHDFYRLLVCGMLEEPGDGN
jgi:carbamoyltransferase